MVRGASHYGGTSSPSKDARGLMSPCPTFAFQIARGSRQPLVLLFMRVFGGPDQIGSWTINGQHAARDPLNINIYMTPCCDLSTCIGRSTNKATWP